MDWHELHKTKVTALREMAKEQGIKGTSGLNKDELVEVLALKLGIPKPHLIVTDAEAKSAIKARIRDLKLKRDEALAAHDHSELKRIRREIHRLKHKTHKMASLIR